MAAVASPLPTMLQGQLRVDTTFVPDIQRVNDSHIMYHLLEQGSFSKTDICRINYCRLYLQAVTVSDISNATGTYLAPRIRTGDPTLWSGVTTYHKTNQSRPNSTSWRLWSKAMELFSEEDKLFVPLTPSTMDDSTKLATALVAGLL
jgi:hypothetical protein